MDECVWAESTYPGEMLRHLSGRASSRKLRPFVVACAHGLSGHMTGPMRTLVDVAERYADGAAGEEEMRAARGPAFPADSRPFSDADRVREEPAARHVVDRAAEPALGGTASPSSTHRFDWRTDWVIELAVARASAYPSEPLDRVIAQSELASQSISHAVDRALEATYDGDPWEAAVGVYTEAAEAVASVGPYDEYETRAAAEVVTQAELLREIFGHPDHPPPRDLARLTADVLALAHGIYAERAFDRLPILADALQEAGCEDVDILAHCRNPGTHVRGCWVVGLVLGRE